MFKSKILRILVVLLLLVTFVGYFAFSTLLYPPFESGLGVDVSGLVPRQVDYFVARADLGRAFGTFPRLRVADDLDEHEAWQTWTASPEAATLAADVGYAEMMANLQTQLNQLPAGVGPLDIFGANDLAVAGNFKGGSPAEGDWAVYGTLTTPGKMGIALLAFPSLLELDKQGISVEKGEGFVTLRGDRLPQPISIARVLDVGVISNSPDLVQKAIELEVHQFKDSFLAGSTYHDKIQLADRNSSEDEVEIYVNTRALLESMKVTGAWPDPDSQDIGPSLLAKFFQLGVLNRITGILGIDEGISLDLNAKLSSELMSSMQTRVYRQRPVSSEEFVDKYAIFAPADTGAFLYLKCDIGDLLTAVFDSMEPATKSLIEERFQGTGKYKNLQQLIDEVDSALLDHMVIIVRENDFPEDPEGPPHNDTPVPAVAVMTWLADGGQEKIDELRHTIGGMRSSIGLQGAEPGASGFYFNRIGGREFNEYWSPYIEGTGVMIAGTTSKVFLVSNTIQMMDHVHKTWTQGAPEYPRLSERSDFSTLARSVSHGANLGVWLNPKGLESFLDKSADQWAMESIHIDWAFERNRVETKILREQYGGKQRAALTELEIVEFEGKVDTRIDEIDQEVRREQIPLAREAYDRKFKYLSAMSGGLLMVTAHPKELDVSLRVMTPLDK
jgi:hypothetical protein